MNSFVCVYVLLWQCRNVLCSLLLVYTALTLYWSTACALLSTAHLFCSDSILIYSALLSTAGLFCFYSMLVYCALLVYLYCWSILLWLYIDLLCSALFAPLHSTPLCPFPFRLIVSLFICCPSSYTSSSIYISSGLWIQTVSPFQAARGPSDNCVNRLNVSALR